MARQLTNIKNATTLTFFGPLGGVFVGAGASKMMRQYIENVKATCALTG